MPQNWGWRAFNITTWTEVTGDEGFATADEARAAAQRFLRDESEQAASIGETTEVALLDAAADELDHGLTATIGGSWAWEVSVYEDAGS